MAQAGIEAPVPNSKPGSNVFTEAVQAVNQIALDDRVPGKVDVLLGPLAVSLVGILGVSLGVAAVVTETTALGIGAGVLVSTLALSRSRGKTELVLRLRRGLDYIGISNEAGKHGLKFSEFVGLCRDEQRQRTWKERKKVLGELAQTLGYGNFDARKFALLSLPLGSTYGRQEVGSRIKTNLDSNPLMPLLDTDVAVVWVEPNYAVGGDDRSNRVSAVANLTHLYQAFGWQSQVWDVSFDGRDGTPYHMRGAMPAQTTADNLFKLTEAEFIMEKFATGGQKKIAIVNLTPDMTALQSVVGVRKLITSILSAYHRYGENRFAKLVIVGMPATEHVMGERFGLSIVAGKYDQPTYPDPGSDHPKIWQALDWTNKINAIVGEDGVTFDAVLSFLDTLAKGGMEYKRALGVVVVAAWMNKLGIAGYDKLGADNVCPVDWWAEKLATDPQMGWMAKFLLECDLSQIVKMVTIAQKLDISPLLPDLDGQTSQRLHTNQVELEQVQARHLQIVQQAQVESWLNALVGEMQSWWPNGDLDKSGLATLHEALELMATQLQITAEMPTQKIPGGEVRGVTGSQVTGAFIFDAAEVSPADSSYTFRLHEWLVKEARAKVTSRSKPLGLNDVMAITRKVAKRENSWLTTKLEQLLVQATEIPQTPKVGRKTKIDYKQAGVVEAGVAAYCTLLAHAVRLADMPAIARSTAKLDIAPIRESVFNLFQTLGVWAKSQGGAAPSEEWKQWLSYFDFGEAIKRKIGIRVSALTRTIDVGTVLVAAEVENDVINQVVRMLNERDETGFAQAYLTLAMQCADVDVLATLKLAKMTRRLGLHGKELHYGWGWRPVYVCTSPQRVADFTGYTLLPLALDGKVGGRRVPRELVGKPLFVQTVDALGAGAIDRTNFEPVHID